MFFFIEMETIANGERKIAREKLPIETESEIERVRVRER